MYVVRTTDTIEMTVFMVIVRAARPALVRLRYACGMPPISPTVEGFRVAFRRPLLTFAEIAWRWVIGATAAVLFFLGLVEFLNTLSVTNGELLFLKTRNPFLVSQAIAHV